MLKVIFTGPESSGKTTLLNAIHNYWIWSAQAKEFARFYLSEKMRTRGTYAYTVEELTYIAKGQVFVEQNAMSKTDKLLLCDTDLITLKIWSQEVFSTCDKKIVDMLEGQYKDDNYYWHQRHYFLCSPDTIDWQPDPLRENPFDRDRLFDIYIKELQAHNQDYTILRGDFHTRYYTALSKIDDMLLSPNYASFYN
jgi:nicotinamide riboside kinase